MITAASNLKRWREDPVLFVREVLHAEPDEWQADMLHAFPKHNRLVASACKGPGKTAALAWMAWNFLLTRPHAKVPCTSISGDNLRDCLWSELAAWQKKSPLLMQAFQWTQTRIFAKQHPETWFASSRQWAHDADPHQQANTLAGLHADYLLFLIDEVSEIPDGVVTAAEAALTGGKETKLVMMGNPTRTDGPLWRAVGADRHLWHVTRITGDPDNPKRSPRIDIEEARKQIAKNGRESYVVKVNILGEFPDRQADKLLDQRDCDEAMARGLAESSITGLAKAIGVDVARFGDDASVFAPRQGRMLFQVKDFRGLDNVQLAEQLIKAMDTWDADGAFVDAGGGAGVIDTCRARGHGKRVFEVNFGSRALAPERFDNKRVEMYWTAAEWVKGGGCLPKDQLLAAELSAPYFWFDKRERICLEPKDDIKARLGRSPDRADAFVLTFAGPLAPKPKGATHQTQGGSSKSHWDYNPFKQEAR